MNKERGQGQEKFSFALRAATFEQLDVNAAEYWVDC